MKITRKAKIALGIAGGLTVLSLAVDSPSKEDTASTAPPATTTTARPTTTTQPTAPTVSQSERRSDLTDDIDRLMATFNEASDAAMAADLTGLGVACLRMDDVIDDLRVSGSYVPEVGDAFFAALDLYERSSEACVRGAATGSVEDITLSSELMQLGTEKLNEATEALTK